METSVYVMGNPRGPQKIGIAKNPAARLWAVQSGNHSTISLSFTERLERQAAAKVESHAHWLLRDRRLSGEWFNVTPEKAAEAVRTAIEAVSRGDAEGRPSVGRKMLWPDKVVAPLPEGTLARIDAVREDGESKTDFLRVAVEAELIRRERGRRKK